MGTADSQQQRHTDQRRKSGIHGAILTGVGILVYADGLRHEGMVGMDARARGLRRFLKQGGMVAYPTRAVFGLGCDPRHWGALRALLRLKRRPARKGMIVVADQQERLWPFMETGRADLRERCRARWPGPHTWLVPAHARLPGLLCGRSYGGGHRVALRHDNYPPLANLCHRIGMALVSTSANRSGQRPLTTTRACRQRFGERVRVIPGRCQRHSRPSTVADLLSGSIVRQG